MNEQLEFPQTHGIPRSTIIVRNGIAVSLIFIVLLLIRHMFRDKLMEQNNLMSVIYIIILLISVIITQIQVREKTYGGMLDFSKAFGTGMLLTLLVTAIFAVFNFIFYTFIAPDVMDEVRRMSEATLREKGMSDDQIEMGMKMTNFLTTPLGILLSTIVIYPLMGLIISALASIFTQRKR
jgi:membrane-associated HD superfamily phosphohydrolase